MATQIATILIQLMNGTLNFLPTEVTSTTVGELREELGLTGQISVSKDDGADVIASDATELSADCKVAHIPQAMKGGEGK